MARSLFGPISLPLLSLLSGRESQGVVEDHPINPAYMIKYKQVTKGRNSNRLSISAQYLPQDIGGLHPAGSQPPALRSLVVQVQSLFE